MIVCSLSISHRIYTLNIPFVAGKQQHILEFTWSQQRRTLLLIHKSDDYGHSESADRCCFSSHLLPSFSTTFFLKNAAVPHSCASRMSLFSGLSGVVLHGEGVYLEYTCRDQHSRVRDFFSQDDWGVVTTTTLTGISFRKSFFYNFEIEENFSFLVKFSFRYPRRSPSKHRNIFALTFTYLWQKSYLTILEEYS